MAQSRSAPRVLVATLFLPETPVFQDPDSQPQLSVPPREQPEHGGSILQQQNAFPDQIAFPSNRQGSANVHTSGNAQVPLSPIHSGTSTPARAESPVPGLHLRRSTPASTGNSRADSSDKENHGPPGGIAGSALAVPRKPALTRTTSIVQDLQLRGVGPMPMLAPLSPKTTDMELGTNPFENASISTMAATPAPMTPSLQSSIASARRPSGVRFTAEGTDVNSRNALGASLRERLERLHAATTPKSQSSLSQSTNGRSVLTPLRGSTPGESRAVGSAVPGTMSSYFGQLAADQGTTAGGPSPAGHRRRSSSVSRNLASEKHSINRTYSRSKKSDARRRSSSSLDAASVGANNPLSPLSPPPQPTFHFEHNIHGNGGLHNAIRSVSDHKLRSASEPMPPAASTGMAAAPAATIKPEQPKTEQPNTRAILGDYLWIGTPGCSTADFDDQLRQSMDKRYKDEKRSVVVWVEDDTLEPAYDMFCKQLLWPAFHYQVHDAHKSKAYESPSWDDYKAMNQAFADKIVSIYQPGDLIWINDYHLLLVPQMLRTQLPNATIGFFLHIAFPSSEIFRCLSVRQELLQGVLGADLIGFQTYNLARHFRQTCQRLLSLEATPKGIQLPTGFAKVGVFSIGIDVKALNERKREAEVADWLATLKERYAGLRVIIGRDKLDEIKGVRKKLVAYECFLEKYPNWRGKVVLIQVAMATTQENEKQGEVMDVVSRINARFSTFTYQPVVFLHQDVSFSQYLALLQVADCFVNASLREGMNLTSHEYVMCQEGNWGPLILSEFTGSYSKAGFHRSIAINPYDKLSFAEAINEALSMPKPERIERWQDLERHVWKQTAQNWCGSFVKSLQREALDVQTRPLASPRMEGKSGLPPVLDISEAIYPYEKARKRLLLVDLEGTLIAGSHHTFQRTKANQATFNMPALEASMDQHLQNLAKESKNTVYIMSGHSPADLENLATNHPMIGFIAENGCYASLPLNQQTPLSHRKWHKLVTGTHDTWRQPVLEILRYYTERTPGSVIDDRGISIVWRYANTTEQADGKARDAHAEKLQASGSVEVRDGRAANDEAYMWARRQAAEVQNHIMDSLGERFGLQLYPGATSFLILPRKAGRATAVAHILQASTDSGETYDPGMPPSATGQQGTEHTHDEGEEEEDDAGARDAADNDDDEHAEGSEEVDRMFSGDVDKAVASRQLLEQFDYVFALTEDQRLCGWLDEMALETVVTVSVGNKRRGTRWRVQGESEVKEVLRALAEKVETVRQ